MKTASIFLESCQSSQVWKGLPGNMELIIILLFNQRTFRFFFVHDSSIFSCIIGPAIIKDFVQIIFPVFICHSLVCYIVLSNCDSLCYSVSTDSFVTAISMDIRGSGGSDRSCAGGVLYFQREISF